MARDLKAQLELTADASGVEAGVGKAKKSLASLGAAAKTEGDKAAAGLEGIGAGGDAAAKKVDRSTRSLIGSIQRTTATLEAGGRTSAKYFETLASQRGVDVGVLKPYLDQLDAVRARQAEATLALAKGGAGLNQYGASAKQTAAALRGVPAQLTDIVTSLQGGQQPLTVLLQQGGQLRDMFGGVVPAARALGGAVVGLINPFTVAAGAVAALGLAYFQGSKEADEYARSLILTNNASGKTVGQLEQMAQRMSAVSGTQSAAAAAVATFASSTVLAGSNIERFSALALRMEKATVQAVGETKKQFEELARSPVAAATKLNDTTNFITDSLYRQIKALEEQGRTAEAAAVAMNAFAADGEAKMARLESRLGTIERAWASITSQAKRAWDAMLNVGRPDTLQDQLSAAQEQLDQRLAQGGPRRGSNRTQQQYEQANQALRDRIDTLKESVRLEGSVADRQRAQVASVQARIDFDKEADKYLSRRVQMEREIARFNQLADKAGASAVERERGLAAIRDKYKTPAGPKRSEDKSTLAFDLSSIKSQAEQLIGTYANSERILESIRAAGLLSDQEYYEAKRGFLRLESQAKESALQDEIARYQREQLTGKDKIDNERKIAEASAKLAMVRADASSRMVVLGNQEAAAQTKVALAYLSARQAAQDYLTAMELQQARGLSGMGRGAVQRDRDAGLNQIEDRYAGQRRDLENNRAQLELEGKFTQDARAQYEQRLAIINEFQSKATASFLGYYDRLQAANANWTNGAGEALQNYIDQSRTVAQQTEQLFTNAFGNMEDALVSFVTTGKLDFSDLADSIVADITRIIIKQQLLAPLAASLQGGMSSGSGAGGFISSILGNLFGGGRAIGGAVSAGRLYQVNERRPELLDVGGKQFLMMGNQNGRVDANRAPAASGSTHNYNIHVSMPQGASRATAQQFGQQVARQLSMAQARNG